MATLSGGDITALVCSTWNISDAPGRPAYPGDHSDHKRRAAPHASADSRSPAMERPAIVRRTPTLPPGTGLQPSEPCTREGLRLPQSGGRRLSRQTPQRSGYFGPKQTPGVVGSDVSCDQRIARRKTRTQEGVTWLTHLSRISGPSPVWVATDLWMVDPRAGAARAKMAWASGIKPAF